MQIKPRSSLKENVKLLFMRLSVMAAYQLLAGFFVAPHMSQDLARVVLMPFAWFSLAWIYAASQAYIEELRRLSHAFSNRA